MYRHILIAVDGSEQSKGGLTAGLDIAEFAGAKVTVLTVSEPFPVYDLASKMGLFQDPKEIESYNTTCKSVAERILAEAGGKAAARAVDCETLHIENSAPAAAILEAARFRSCDLIVLASHGLRGFERFVMGSQAARVVQGAEVSVLVVR
ncbi:universal stress protein [Aureimonas sp. Leaf324]|jgi:nucleotide-binding universal stress UspA family protein|uniref:universal stress protein n=1 Tax=Aureimonas sp. Leaf324 TaxID=1736336 RepID=UPI00070028DA|nr:universal stress protein [Aureimonas sp. Leaf324]KQQ84748.1 hypothetical protein ASF65_20135 [Aureimonas sp. Leaf324]